MAGIQASDLVKMRNSHSLGDCKSVTAKFTYQIINNIFSSKLHECVIFSEYGQGDFS
jgi:hypothetical protein